MFYTDKPYMFKIIMEVIGESDIREEGYEDVMSFLMTGLYPKRFKGNCGLKTNLRRQASRFSVKDGVLHYKHKLHRNSQESKYPAYFFLIAIVALSACYFI
jgi:hypothetical protein